jgi:putative spermidine/putrescine transport system permease protein
MRTNRPLRWALGAGSVVTLVFLWAPLALIALYAFNDSNTPRWPFAGFTWKWMDKAIHNSGAQDALWLSVRVAFGAACIALLLGTLLSFALARFDFFGKNALSFLVILPIALPGIVTGLALNQTFVNFFGGLSVLTVIIAHSTFCVVIVYNNVVARLRRSSANVEEASADLGARSWQTFAFVTFPLMRSALLAGGLLAFALSMDEVIVTTFTLKTTGAPTLPIWIFQNISRPNQLPIVYAVCLIVMILSAIPVYIASRLAGDAVTLGRT